MNKYELMYILDPSLEGDARKELIDRFAKLLTDNGAQIDKSDEWGKRRLAYPIDFKNEGYYVLVNFRAEPTVPTEIERNLRISEMVIRSMIVKIEEKRSSVKPRPVQVRPAIVPFGQPAPAAPATTAEATAPAATAAPSEPAAAPAETATIAAEPEAAPDEPAAAPAEPAANAAPAAVPAEPV
ncbi:MAG: 30S ribosomal protein S6 [Oscillospiraceae bacterium]|nr:30S ribosomal protein S6 [Oscillospiraceae bacterium]